MSKARWVDYLSEEDLAFLKRFLLASGSLKALAEVYKITYPTVRLRLDRLIQKIEILDNEEMGDGFERMLRGLFAEGKLDNETFRTLLKTYQKNRLEESVHEK